MRLRLLLLLTGTIGLLASLPASAHAIPAFARRYGVSCNLCHAPAPRLNAFGEQFAANGFELQPGEAPRDTIDTGDGLLRLLRRIEFALRLELFATASTPVREAAGDIDLQMPYNIKLLSGGPLANRISYYMYFFLSERGEVAGLEDAYIQFTDIGGSGVSVLAGQFQVSDPLFKRELRLPYEDYQAYRVRVGEARSDMTYDRGLMVTAAPWEGGDLAVSMVNGAGLSAADADRQFDTDALKNFALRISQELGPLRVGGFAYFGEQRVDTAADRIRVYGPDATLRLGNLELNAQYLRRTDSDPVFDGLINDTEVDAVFGEIVFSPAGPTGRWHFTALYNWIDAALPIFTLRAGEETPLSHYESVSGSMHYLLQRNVRLLGEAGYDVERKRTRFTFGGVLAW